MQMVDEGEAVFSWNGRHRNDLRRENRDEQSSPRRWRMRSPVVSMSASSTVPLDGIWLPKSALASSAIYPSVSGSPIQDHRGPSLHSLGGSHPGRLGDGVAELKSSVGCRSRHNTVVGTASDGGEGCGTLLLWIADDRPGEGTSSASMAFQSTPQNAVLCFHLKDVEEVVSSDVVQQWGKERQRQCLEVHLFHGATVHVAGNVMETLSSSTAEGHRHLTGNDGKPTDASLRVPGVAAPPTLYSFIFTKGGITRCVASMKRYLPSLPYVYSTQRVSSPFIGREETTATYGTDSTRDSSPILRKGHCDPFHDTDDWPKSGSQSINGDMQSRSSSLYFTGPHRRQSSDITELVQSSDARNYHTSWLSRLSPRVFFRGNHGLKTAGTASHDNTGESGRGSPAIPSSHPGVSAILADNPQSTSSFVDLGEEMSRCRSMCRTQVPVPKLSDPPMSSPYPATKAMAQRSPLRVMPPTSLQFSSDAEAWQRCFASSGTGVIDADQFHEFRLRVYEQGGLVESSVRFDVWMYVLKTFPLCSTALQRGNIIEKAEKEYNVLKGQWTSFVPEQEANFTAFRTSKDSILKDVERTDRTHPEYAEDSSKLLQTLRDILITHVMYNVDLGYTQGMSDVASVVALIAPSEPAAFFCFRSILLQHMAPNFVIEERRHGSDFSSVKGLQRKLLQVQMIVRHFHPRLYGHLRRKCMVEDMLFCFRWLLVNFKREMGSLEDTMRLWDVFFCCPYTTSYEVVMAAALLCSFGNDIVELLFSYEGVAQFVNSLKGNVTVDQMLHCAKEFYLNSCVPESRRLIMELPNAVESAVKEPSSATMSAASSEARPPAVDTYKVAESYFPTVDELVELLLNADGEL